jgi:hypothetical protein
MSNFSLAWASLLPGGRELHANHSVVIASWPNHISCFSLEKGASLLLLPITRWSEHRVTFAGDVPLLLRRPSFGNFEMVPLLIHKNSPHWRIEVPESEDAATLRGDLVLASSPWAIQLSRISSDGSLRLLWEDRTSSKAKQLFISEDGSLVGAELQSGSCVWSTTRNELLWHGLETLCCLGRWGWLASSSASMTLFDPVGHAMKVFPSFEIMAQSDRYIIFFREAKGFRLDLQTSEVRTIPMSGVSAAALFRDILYVGGQNEVRVFDSDLSLQLDISPKEWTEAYLFSDSVTCLLPSPDALLALTRKQLICLR